MLLNPRLQNRMRACWGALALLLATPGFLPAAATWEYAEEPALSNNFAEARFRLWIPASKAPLKGILFLALGTDSDGLFLANDRTWQDLARKLHFGLVSCHFRGEGESYENARGGSGQALLNALTDFGRQAKRQEIADLPLVLWGHSSGGQFAYTFACWKPQRVLGFIAIKWASVGDVPEPGIEKLPALIIAGQHDEAGRNKSLAQVYQEGRALDAPWAFLLEKNAGHDLGRTGSLSIPFIRAVVEGGNSRPVFVDVAGGEIQDTPDSGRTDPNLSRLPNRETAEIWRHLHQPCDIAAFPSPSSNSNPSLGFSVNPGLLDWGKIPWNSSPVKGSAQIHLKDLTRAGSLKLAIQDPRIRGELVPDGEQFLVHLTLDPRNLPMGPYRSKIDIQYLAGGRVLEELEFPVYGLVISDVAAQPASLYLGVLPRKSQASFKLKIVSDSPGLKLLDVSSSEPEWIQVQNTGSTPESLDFECLVKTGTRIGRRHGKLVFKVQTDEPKEIAVPYIGFVGKN